MRLLEIRKDKGTIPYRLMISRQCRMDEMIRAGWTIDELITLPAWSKIVISKSSMIGKPTGVSTPELREERNKKHCVEWKVARERYYRWYNTYDACNKPKWYRPNTYKK